MKHKEQFFKWLEDIKYLLPLSMTLYEARLLFERKLKDEEESKHKSFKSLEKTFLISATKNQKNEE